MWLRFDKTMQTTDVFLGNEMKSDGPDVDDWGLYDNLTGHPMVVYPKRYDQKDGFLVPKQQMMIGRAHDESTLLTLAHACQRAIGLTQRPPLSQFLAQKDEILADEKFPDENNDVMPMEVQLRFVLDQKNRVVLVEMEGVQYK
jgi:hypothetical protein